MKLITNGVSQILSFTSFAIMMATSTFAESGLIVLADDLERADVETVLGGFDDIFERLGGGDDLLGLDAESGKIVFHVSLPSDAIYDSHAGLRRKIFDAEGPEIVAAMRKIVIGREEALPSPAPGQIDIPNVLDQLAYNAAPNTEVAIIGNPIFHNPSSPDHSMLAKYPTAGNFYQDRLVSPFGGRGYEGSLSGMRVHICITDAVWVNPAHEEGVERAYGQMIAQRGGILATFSSDILGCLKRFAAGRANGVRDFTGNPIDDRVAMIDPTMPVVVPLVSAVSARPASEPSLAKEIASGVTEMRLLTFYDTDAEDGDVVEIVGTAFSETVELVNAHQTIEVPVKLGSIEVIGQASGRGDITIGILTENGVEIIQGGIKVGQSVTINLN